MAAEALKPVYLIAGGDRPKVARAIQRLRARFHPQAVEILSAASVGGEEAVAACNALGLFGASGRLVLVEEAERWKEKDVEAIAGYLKSPAPATVLCLVAAEAKQGSPLVKVCRRAGQVLVYELARRDLAKWVQAELARRGARATPEACRLLLELVGERPEELALEAEKLALWAQGSEIDVAEVEELVYPRAEVPSWALTDAWGRRDVAGVLSAWQRLRSRGGREAEPSSVVWRLAEHVALVRSCRSLAAEGIRPEEATKRLKRRSEYPVRKAYQQAEGFDDGELRAALVRLAEVDAALKGESPLPDELELERALVDVTRGRGPVEKGRQEGG